MPLLVVDNMSVSFRAVLEAAPDAMIIADPEGHIVLVNAQAEKVFGYARAEMLGRPVEMLIPASYRHAHVSWRAGYRAAPGVRAMGSGLELLAARKGGAEFPVEISLSPIDTGHGVLVAAAIRDVSERRRAERERLRLAAIVETSDDAIYSKTLEGVIESWNSAAASLFGWSAAEIIGQNASILAPVGVEDDISEVLQRVAVGERHNHHETVRMRKGGDLVEVSISVSPILDRLGHVVGASTIARDIGARKREARMMKSLQEKEVLLKEIHHRVKNNLQVISSLLSLQASYVTDPRALEMFRESQDRVRSIAIFHERLYRTPDLAAADVGEYLRSLVSSLLGTYGTRTGHVEIAFEVASFGVGVDVAIPLGLILNELVSNALKHAFAGGGGHIQVTFVAPDERSCRLTVADDGVGLPAGFDAGDTPSLGLQLVSTLTEQLGGTLETGTGPGACFTVCFPWPRAA
jgi:PAS domain S-box-containing protein